MRKKETWNDVSRKNMKNAENEDCRNHQRATLADWCAKNHVALRRRCVKPGEQHASAQISSKPERPGRVISLACRDGQRDTEKNVVAINLKGANKEGSEHLSIVGRVFGKIQVGAVDGT
ncbi:hypothetical protein HAX54_018909 [Datura stramonium]|uniref:Uncharacterized protein n=1 Tax=Datura stramonium TaxID=4076 RepID=A0ABS8S1G3_DATST|nr:hypothetical protein [Datura stramonium]